jgi:sodium/bile acid cotransporter 7
MGRLSWLRLDRFTLALLATVAVASLLPLRGTASSALAWATQFVVALVFFLHGMRLSRSAVLTGMANWRLHASVLGATFLLFPLLGLIVLLPASSLLPPNLAKGILFLCCLPSTMQASVAFTAIAGGNVPAAVCSASLSNLAGVLATPLLLAVLLGTSGGISLGSVEDIVLRILVPFMLGQLLHPLLGAWALRHNQLLGAVDRGSILLVVYSAFSEAGQFGLWHQVDWTSLGLMAGIDAVLLALALGITMWSSRALGFARGDEIAIMFCGSKKSLLAGVPMANILFAGPMVGMLLLPLMLFHQMQLIACAMLARRYAEGSKPSGDAERKAVPVLVANA